MSDKRSPFIERATQRHRSKYDYSKVEYVNARTKVLIGCAIHGGFYQLPRKHLSGQGCPKCGAVQSNSGRQLSTFDFISRSLLKHGLKYDYSKTVFVNSTTKVDIICPTHGVFQQYPGAHMRGFGCKKCADYSRKFNITVDDFITTAIDIHNNEHDYSGVVFNSIDDKIVVSCKVHGNFTTTPRRHLNGNKCRKCANASHGLKCRKPVAKWLEDAKEANPQFDYSLSDFTKEIVTVICEIHGEQLKSRKELMKPTLCRQCSYLKFSVDNSAKSRALFTSTASNLHNNRYDYSKVKYVNQLVPVAIECPTHGLFEQSPKHHLRGSGCPKCSISSGHSAILNFINSIYHGDVIVNDRDIIAPYEVDIFIPDRKLGIEFHGVYWHSFDSAESYEEKYRHALKADLAKDFKLLQFFESEWLTKPDIVKSMISNAFGNSNKIHARKCVVKQIDNGSFVDCCNRWHLSGGRPARFCYGLFYEGELISVIGFSGHCKYDFEIIRFATKLGCVIVGGLSKLLKHFIRSEKPSTIFTYADRRHSVGNSYLKCGFVNVGHTGPNYFYVLGNRMFSRQRFQKRLLAGKLRFFNAELSESENMFVNGYRRIWDAGHCKLLLTPNMIY